MGSVLSLGAGRPLLPTGRACTLSYVKILIFDDRRLITHDRQHQVNPDLLNQLGHTTVTGRPACSPGPCPLVIERRAV
jgi:hypothetical protein